jgi:signal transduction histidine kinase
LFLGVVDRYEDELKKIKIETFAVHQNLMKSIREARNNERERISRDLHDDVGATLGALKLHLSSKSRHSSAVFKEYYEQSIKLVDKVSNDIRSISHDLISHDFTISDLFQMLESHTDGLNKSGKIKFNLLTESDEGCLHDKTVAVILNRIVKELINNIIKHSEATEASIQIAVWLNMVQIIVEDNGIGMGNSGGRGIGLRNIYSRVDYLNGKISIDSGHKGTTVIIIIPGSTILND